MRIFQTQIITLLFHSFLRGAGGTCGSSAMAILVEMVSVFSVLVF